MRRTGERGGVHGPEACIADSGLARAMVIAIGLAALSVSVASSNPTTPPSALTPGTLRHTISAAIDPERQSLHATDVLEIDASTLATPTTPIRFLLHEGLTVEAITVRDEPLRFTALEGFNPKHFWERPDYAALSAYGHVREVEVQSETPWRSPVSLTVRYSGAIDDTLHPPEEDYGRSFETTTGLIDARGAYFDGGTAWYPTIPDDPHTFSLAVTVPGSWDVVSQGDTPKREERGGKRIVSITCNEPMDGIYLVAGPWRRTETKHGPTDILVYFYQDDPELRTKYVTATERYLDRYASLLGPYPFSKFAVVENFWETGYGMPSFTLLGSTVLRLPFIIDTSYGHEILHCWWGNGVYVDADHGNWCEGLTSYLADHAYKEAESPAAAAEYRRDQLTGYLNFVRDARDIPLTAFRERHSGATQAIGYGKCLFVFHMLRRSLGDETFFRGLRSLYETHKFREASWGDVFASFENASGRDLAAFRAEWIERTGAPRLSLLGASAEAAGDGFRVRGELSQEEPFYHLDVPVEVTLADGSSARQVVTLGGASSSFQIDVASPPARVNVDPTFDVFRRLDRLEIPPVLNQTMGAESTLVVMSTSVDAEAAAGYEVLRESLAREPGVRVAREVDVDLSGLTNVAVWLLGPTRFDTTWEKSVPASPVPGAEKGRSWIATKRHPSNGELSWTRIVLAEPAHAAAIARKIPHYGRYSYLVFEGATNVEKGIWTLDASPLIHTFSGDTP